jgi:hypothetical protein
LERRFERGLRMRKTETLDCLATETLDGKFLEEIELGLDWSSNTKERPERWRQCPKMDRRLAHLRSPLSSLLLDRTFV